MLTQTSTTLLNTLLAEPADQGAWRTFCDRYGPAVYRFARRQGLAEADADEVLSDTLTTFFEAYRAGRYERQRGRLRTWVFGIAMNKAREMRRTLARNRPTDSLEHLTDEPATDAPDTEFEDDVERTIAFQCLDHVRTRVAPLTYQAFDLYVLKGRPPDEVARVLGIDTPKVYVAKSRVLSYARREYENLRKNDEEE
jgi:RNA polymerase sigma-70 factor (ECF subfamily)